MPIGPLGDHSKDDKTSLLGKTENLPTIITITQRCIADYAEICHTGTMWMPVSQGVVAADEVQRQRRSQETHS